MIGLGLLVGCRRISTACLARRAAGREKEPDGRRDHDEPGAQVLVLNQAWHLQGGKGLVSAALAVQCRASAVLNAPKPALLGVASSGCNVRPSLLLVLCVALLGQ
jgi:hypothetical protein